jgi:hypothetical protein
MINCTFIGTDDLLAAAVALWQLCTNAKLGSVSWKRSSHDANEY